ncbi:MAG TPA: DUF2071 domain-containing protein [Vicinamibacterales bacterium]|nr:DUF2071 domain-containing protein [Vicinamibacterales bacterium]
MAAAVAAVWLIHGLYNKLLGGSPRHLAIVQSVPGLDGETGRGVLLLVGLCEVAIAGWILSKRAPRTCAAAQTGLLLSMNALELTYARDLLIWPAGLLPINALFLAAAWTAAGWRGPRRLRARLARHPLPIDAHFRECLSLTYALPAEVLRPLLPPGLELETVNGSGFLAVALVQAEALRPSPLPAAAGQDFFLAGYRVFARFRTRSGRSLRGLRILRSDTDRRPMVVAGNLLTHYKYHRCTAALRRRGDALDIEVRTPDGRGDLRITAHPSQHRLPPGSPFASTREAGRFAGPLPFTFDYEPDTHAIVAVQASRTSWRPAAIAVDVERLAFFDQAPFRGCTPRLAAAFHVADVDYHWHRGVRHAL